MDILIDFSVTGSRAEFHDAFAEALTLPDWYGRNLDALHDCLTDVSQDIRLHLLHWDTLQIALGTYTDNARRAILHAAATNPHLSVSFE
jgi:ribonuclease inhibitor